MKKTAVFIFFFIYASSPSWADDNAINTYETLDIYAQATQSNNSNPVITLETDTPPMIPMASAIIEAPKLSKEDNAILHLSLIRETADDIKEAGIFSNLFSSDSALETTLLQDIHLFLAVYGDLPIASEALFLQGQIQKKQGLEEAAAVSWLQTIYEYPSSDAEMRARQALSDLIDSDWDKFADKIKVILGNVPQADKATRLSSLINQLYPLDDKDLIQALRDLQFDFLQRFANDYHADEVQILMAHNMGAESAESGIFGFKKLLALYPNSSYRAEAMLAIADLQRVRLKAYEKAEANYKILIQEYPEHKLIKNAYKNLALTQDKHLKQYHQAIATYQAIVTRYPEDKLALTSLQQIAVLQEKKTDEPRKAIDTLRKLATMFHGVEATDALEDAIRIANRRIDDGQLAYDIQAQLLKDYPKSDAAPKALFAMAEYAEQKLKDANQAKALYQQFMQQYPEHRLAKKVAERLAQK